MSSTLSKPFFVFEEDEAKEAAKEKIKNLKNIKNQNKSKQITTTKSDKFF